MPDMLGHSSSDIGPATWRVLAHRWQESFDRSPIGQAVTSLDGHFLEVNDSLCQLTGYPREALLSRTFKEITHPDDLQAAADLMGAMLSGQVKGGRYEKRYVRQDGGVIWGEVTVTLVRDAQGRPDYFVTMVIDINERKGVKAKLYERDALLTSLSRNIPGTVLKFDITPDGRFELPYASDGIGELYEMDPQLVRDNPMLAFDRIHPDDRPASMRLMERQIAAMQSNTGSTIPAIHEYRLVLPRKGVRHMRAMISVEAEPDGRTALYCYITDITEQRQYEQALIQVRAAEAASHAKSEFLSRMSHELRTPLNAVIGFSQILRMDTAPPLSAVQTNRVKLIERAGEHLLAMIDDVLDLSRIEAGSLSLSLETLNVCSTLTESLELVADSANKAQVVLVAPQVEGDLYVRADRVRLRQVLLNLLSNAIKYNRVGGEVRCHIWREADRVLIDIADTGTGLTEDELQHLFEPFNRLGAENSEVQGTGIGLMIVRHLVELMAGRIEVSSVPGSGTHFVVNLPAAASPEPPAKFATLDGPAEQQLNPALRHVLYAEDNPVNVMLVREILKMRADYKLTVTTTGADVLHAARSLHPDLLLLDMHLGDMTAFDVAGALDRDPATARIPRVMLSADAMPDTIRAARAHGFVAYLTKPLDVAALLQCLDEQLRRS
ncbi:MAG: PAS domain S-box protein [Burkholderiales bacterium]|nr:PAS domain S-box protein [Burkholderiales bacterium]